MLRRIGFSDRWAKVFDGLVLFFAGIAVFTLIGWLDYSEPVHVRFRVFKDLSVPPGGMFIYENHFTRTRYCDTTVDRWFVTSDNVIKRIDPLPSSMPTEGLNLKQRSEARIKVPWDMPPGQSKSCFQVHWQCTPLQKLWPINGPETCVDFMVEPIAPLSFWRPFDLPLAVTALSEAESEP